MKKFYALLTFLILVGIFIPAVSAEIIIDENINTYVFTGGQSTYPNVGYVKTSSFVFDRLYFKDITKANDLSYIVVECEQDAATNEWVSLPKGTHSMEYTLNGVNNTGTIHVYKSYNFFGQLTHQKVTFFFDNWNIGTLIGPQTVTFTPNIGSISTHSQNIAYPTGSSIVELPHYRLRSFPYKITTSCGKLFKQHITIDAISDYDINVIVDRSIDGAYFASNVSIYDDGGIVIFKDESQNDIDMNFLASIIDTVRITNIDTVYTYPIKSSAGGSDSSTVTIYVRNSQTNALLANANIVISANVNGNFHEVENETVPSGIYSIELQPTGGGMPNPDFYRLWVTLDGYNSQMPYMDIEFKEGASVYVYLDPIGGAPEDENNTFIDFFVRDMSANPISGATVNFGGYTLITNSAGYTIFEVDKNKTYSWTVSKSGYGSLTGNAIIGGNARHTINTVIAPAVTPTTPTSIPTSTPISPTPTMTSPTGEPVSNWLEWFAAHFGMVLGGGAEIGKIFMWLCFSVPVGVYVGKEAKAGAAGFMAGAGVVTLFFVLIGWVPIWLLVLLALIIGLLYAKIFNNSDNGGGR